MKRLLCLLFLTACSGGSSDDAAVSIPPDLVVPIVRVDEWQIPYIQAEIDGRSMDCPADTGAASVWLRGNGKDGELHHVCVSGFCRDVDVWFYADVADPCIIGLDFFGGSQYEFDLEAMVLRVTL